MFHGTITDCFEMRGKGLVVMLTDVEGEPQIGGVVEFFGGHLTIVDVGQNLTDDRTVSTRSCLTGKKVAPYCTVLLEWPEGRPVPEGVYGAPLGEVKLL